MPHKYPLLVISELQHKTSDTKYYSRLNLKSVYNLIRMGADNKWETAFLTKQELFKQTMIPLGPTNASSLFLKMKDSVFNDMEAHICYLDNILTYPCNTEDEHKAIVDKAPQQYVEHGPAVYLLNRNFHLHNIIFL